MKVVQINTSCGIGSTGKICVSISKLLSEKQFENYILYSNRTDGYPLGIGLSSARYIRVQALKSRLFGNYGFNSERATRGMLSELDHIQPDIVHLHNIHSHDCNLDMLFAYLRAKHIKVIWTFHDCWSFTAYCPHFTITKCAKWKEGCYSCPVYHTYSWFFDRSAALYQKKKRALSDLDLTVVTPSHWLADLVRQSFLKEKPVLVIPNGIDLELFQPTASVFREQHRLTNKKLVLGVSFDWDRSKGLDVFISLSKLLPEDYRIVLVGTDAEVEKQLPPSILSIRRTQNQRELAKIYSAADVFLNATREDNFPTVNLEALACGTPVVTFRTGGSPECLDERSGAVVAQDDLEGTMQELLRICTDRPYSPENCRARAMCFDRNRSFQAYVDLYRR